MDISAQHDPIPFISLMAAVDEINRMYLEDPELEATLAFRALVDTIELESILGSFSEDEDKYRVQNCQLLYLLLQLI